MTGQAGVWMLLLLFPCLCTSMRRSPFFRKSSHPAAPACCGQSLAQGKSLITGQKQIQKILFDNRKIIFEKVDDDIEHIKEDVGSVLQNQATSQDLIRRCQSQVLTNLTVVTDRQGDAQDAMAKFQEFVDFEFGTLQKLQKAELEEISQGRAAIEEAVKNEHQGTRKFVAQTGNSIENTIEELKGIMKAVHAGLAALAKQLKPCCDKGQGKKGKRQGKKGLEPLFH